MKITSTKMKSQMNDSDRRFFYVCMCVGMFGFDAPD